MGLAEKSADVLVGVGMILVLLWGLYWAVLGVSSFVSAGDYVTAFGIVGLAMLGTGFVGLVAIAVWDVVRND
jgi:hypothetical protein